MLARVATFAICLFAPLVANADQWATRILAHCYALDSSTYSEHFFVRAFLTEAGGSEFDPVEGNSGGAYTLRDIARAPIECQVSGRSVRLELIDYREPTASGQCGACEDTGFQLSVDGSTVWKAEPPEQRGRDPIFNGTIDVNRDMARVCTEHRPEELGVELPYKPDFLASRTSILVCETTKL